MVTNPVDIIKTRVMNQRSSYSAVASEAADVYKSPWDCFSKTLRSEGPFALYKGAMAAWLRLGPHTIVTFMVFEQLRAATGTRPL